jgi:hypothetical protein
MTSGRPAQGVPARPGSQTQALKLRTVDDDNAAMACANLTE